MYEPEKILVQNAGIDPGVAALLQNANKGNMDPAALMAMMNNGGFGGNGGWWWIWIILIFFCWGGFGGNGFGRGSDDASRLASQLNTDTNTSLLMQAIQGNKDAISTLSNTLSCDINAVQTALNTINTSVSQIACDTKLASCEVINAITSGNANLASQLANCCCQTQRSIDSVNLNLTQMNADNRLSICQQTNTLQNAITGGFIQDLLLLLIKKKQLIWLDRTIMSSKLKKKQQVSMMKKWISVKIFQINQKHRQKILQ